MAFTLLSSGAGTDMTMGVKLAPTRMHHFITELLVDLPLRGRVVSVEVLDETYLVTLALANRRIAVSRLSAYELSRSMRGDQEALDAVRTHLLRQAAERP